jgi:hypothetical protein
MSYSQAGLAGCGNSKPLEKLEVSKYRTGKGVCEVCAKGLGGNAGAK